MLIRKQAGSKKVHLNVDSLSYWMATNNAKDNILKQQYFERYGIAEGLRRLAAEHPFSPNKKRADTARPETTSTTVIGVGA
jgi:type IV secretion system protein TrbE